MPPKKPKNSLNTINKRNPNFYPVVEELADRLGWLALLTADPGDPRENETSMEFARTSALLISRLPDKVVTKHGSPFPQIVDLTREPIRPPKDEISLHLAELDEIDNGIIEDMAHGLTPEQSAENREVDPRRLTDYQTALMEVFEAVTPAHLVRKVTAKKHGKLPMKTIVDYPLETKMQLTVLQYLSFGFTPEEIAPRIHNKRIPDVAGALQVISEILDRFNAKNQAHAVYIGLNYGLLGCEEERFVHAKEVERQAARSGILIAEED